MPLRLAASQRWTVAGRGGGAIGENGLLVGEGISGSGSALTVEQSNASALIFAEDDSEVGPLTLEGQSAGIQHIENGLVILGEADLNASDQQPVSLRNIYFEGVGAVGPLNVQSATLAIGSEERPAGALTAASVSLDSASGVIFEINGEGDIPGVDYSQLVARGQVDLNDASAVLVAAPATEGGPCPTLRTGETFTLVSTSGSLSGSFADVGPEVPIHFAASCNKPSQSARIEYHRNGATQTVTATVEAAVEEAQEAAEKAAKEHEEELATTKKHEEAALAKQREELQLLAEAHAKQVVEEATAGRKREEEATAAKRLQEEASIAKDGVLAAQEASPAPVPTRSQLLAKALKACGKQKTKRKRAQCAVRARKRYGRKKTKGGRKA